jgi:putative addiction module killer protein
MWTIFHYRTAFGKVPFQDWFDALKDAAAETRIAARLERILAGNFGDAKSVGDGVFELRVDHGPGYRIYYAVVGRDVILLLCGGDKRRQSTDIAAAIGFLKDYKRRSIHK